MAMHFIMGLFQLYIWALMNGALLMPGLSFTVFNDLAYIFSVIFFFKTAGATFIGEISQLALVRTIALGVMATTMLSYIL